MKIGLYCQLELTRTLIRVELFLPMLLFRIRKLDAMPQMHVGSCVFLNVYLINLNKKLGLFHDIFRQYKEPICLEVTPNNLTILKMSLVYCLSFWGKHLQSLMQGLESSWGPKSCHFRFYQAKPDWSPEQLCSTQGCRIITVTSDFFPDVAVSPGRHTRLGPLSL